MPIRSVHDARKATLEVLKNEIPETIKNVISEEIDKAISKGLGSVNINVDKLVDKNSDIQIKMKTMKKLGTFVRSEGFTVSVPNDCTTLEIQWI